MNRWQNFYLIRKWPDEAEKANNQFAESAGPETCSETYQATILGPDHPAAAGSFFFSSEKNTFDWYQYLESSTKHHFHGHIFMKWTRMHSSRMRTICCSDRGVCVCLWGSAQGGSLPRGSSSQGGCLPGGVCWGCLPGGVCWGGESQHALRQTAPPPWTEFLTHTCQNITFP